jgi:hypothetical protein
VQPLVKAMAKDRKKRWQTVKEFDQALAAAAMTAGSSKSPTSGTGMWLCKWCHTANPHMNRFCAECGWDGMEACPECGEESRVGIRFCGSCGADIREFEEARRLLTRLETAADEKQHEQVIQLAKGIDGFQAKRQPGHGILTTVAELAEKAKHAITRRRELRSAIPRAMERENFEYALRLVEEYESLATDDAFAKLKDELPAKILSWKISESLGKAKESLARKDWAGVDYYCKNVLEQLQPDHAEARKLLKQAAARRWVGRAKAAALIAAACAVVYVLSLGPALAIARKKGPSSIQSVREFYAPLVRLSRNKGLGYPVRLYAKLWKVDLVPEETPPEEKKPKGEKPKAKTPKGKQPKGK